MNLLPRTESCQKNFYLEKCGTLMFLNYKGGKI